MTRKNEKSKDDAGARLVLEVQKLGFRSVPILVYTSNHDKALKIFESLGFNCSVEGSRMKISVD